MMLKRVFADAHEATDRIDVAEQLVGCGLPDHADLGLEALLVLGPAAAA